MDKKISLPEGMIMFLFVASADLAELILIVVPFLTAFISFPVWLIIQLWLIMKGIKGSWFLAGGLFDTLINLIGFDLPFAKTITLLVTIYLANHPKVTAIATGKIKTSGQRT